MSRKKEAPLMLQSPFSVLKGEATGGASFERNRCSAIHEGGHAVAAIKSGFKLISVDIITRYVPGGISRGYTDYEPGYEFDPSKKRQDEEVAKRHLIVVYAGSIAEELLGVPHSERAGNHKDVTDANEIIMSACAVGTPGSFRLDKTRESLLRESSMLASRVFVGTHLQAIERVADALTERRQLSGDEVTEIIARLP